MDINKAVIMGNVGHTPKISQGDNGKMARFSVATSLKYKDKEYTNWHNVVCFDDMICDVIEKYVKKGTRVYIEGTNRTRSYEKDGQTKYTTEIVIPKYKGELILIGKPTSDTGGESDGSSSEPTQTQVESDDGFDDDIPF